LLLGSLQQIATVTISSAVNLLIVGFLLVIFVIIAPNGIIGLVHTYLQCKPEDFVGRRCLHDHSQDRPITATTDRLLEVENLGKRFGGFVALENISLSVAASPTINPRTRGTTSSMIRCPGLDHLR
jgi:hypothetical protein